MKSIKFILPVILFLFLAGTYAQDKEKTSTNQTLQIKSTFLNEERDIGIYLPANYHSSDNRYPVLYLLDGRTHFQHAVGAANFLSTQDLAPDLIVVAVYNVDRNRDFSPVHVERIPTSGGADKFLEFVSDELMPSLDKTYRTSGFNMLMGHSFGGTFAVHSLLTKPELFDAYFAVSPYLQYADNYLVKKAEEALKSNEGQQKYFYMTVGDEPNFFEALDAFSKAVKEKTRETVEFKYVQMKSENHNSIPYLSVFNGLRFVFSDWALPQEKLQQGLDAIDAHFSNVSSKYGFKVETPEFVINALGYRYLQGNDIEKAIVIFKENVKRNPLSPNVFDSLGEAYENNGQLKLAGKNYQKAVQLGEPLKDPNLSVYRINLKRVQQE